MQNDMLMTIKWSKSQLEVEFQEGGRQFSQTGNSNISTLN